MITRGGYSDDYEGKGSVIIARGGYSNDQVIMLDAAR